MQGNDVRFYKYLSPDASISVLTKKQLKWTNPALFNDPFEFPTEIAFQHDENTVADALLEEMVKIVYGPEEPSISVHSPFYSTIAQLLQIRGRKIKPDQKACRAFMATLIRETAANYSRGRHTARDFFESLRARFAVLCVSKKHDDLLMWAHYAQNHSGCVMAFRCLPEKDRPLCAAQEVKYQSEFPSRASVHEYVKFLTGQVVLDYMKIFDIFALTKNNHWKYEEEWLCISLLSDRENGYDFDPIIPEELEAVYLVHCKL
jgi:hypothetical protein